MTDTQITIFTLQVLVHCHIPYAQSLKQKRRVLKSLIERMKNRLNASVAEVSHHDDWQRAVIGLSLISNDRQYLSRQLSLIEQLLLQHADIEIIRIEHAWL